MRTVLRREIRTSHTEGRVHTDRMIGEMRAESRQYTAERIAESRADTDWKVGEMRAHTERLVVEQRLEMRQEMSAQYAETRRHFDVIAEDLGGRMALLAEGLAGLDQKVDRFRAEVATEFQRVDQRFLKLEVQLGRLEQRLERG